MQEIRSDPSIKTVSLKVVHTQIQAIALYMKFGFVITGTIPRAFKWGSIHYDEYEMTPVLQKI